MLAEDAAPLRLWRSGSTQNELERAGYSTSQLRALIAKDRKDIRNFLQAGYAFDDLRQAGYTMRQIIDAGYLGTEFNATEDTLKELAEERATSSRVRSAAGAQLGLMERSWSYGQVQQSASTLANLLDAGYTLDELKQAGLDGTSAGTSNSTYADLIAAGYTAAEISDHARIWQQLEADGANMDLQSWANSSLQLQEELYTRRQSASA